MECPQPQTHLGALLGNVYAYGAKILFAITHWAFGLTSLSRWVWTKVAIGFARVALLGWEQVEEEERRERERRARREREEVEREERRRRLAREKLEWEKKEDEDKEKKREEIEFSARYLR